MAKKKKNRKVVNLSDDTYSLLESKKIHKNQSFDEVIRILLEGDKNAKAHNKAEPSSA